MGRSGWLGMGVAGWEGWVGDKGRTVWGMSVLRGFKDVMF